jgi:hypothetical protein
LFPITRQHRRIHVQGVIVKLQSLKKPLVHRRKYPLIHPLGKLIEKSLIGVLSAYPLPAVYPADYIIMPRYFRMQKPICSTPHAYPKTLDDLSRSVTTI